MPLHNRENSLLIAFSLETGERKYVGCDMNCWFGPTTVFRWNTPVVLDQWEWALPVCNPYDSTLKLQPSNERHAERIAFLRNKLLDPEIDWLP